MLAGAHRLLWTFYCTVLLLLSIMKRNVVAEEPKAGQSSERQRRRTSDRIACSAAEPTPTLVVPDLHTWIYKTYYMDNTPAQYAGQVVNYRKLNRTITHLVVQYPHAEDEDEKGNFDVPLQSDWELIEEGDPGHHIRPYQTSVAALKQAKLQDPEVLERRKNASRRFLSTWLQRARLAYRPLLCLGRADAEKKSQRAKQMDIDIEHQRKASWEDEWTDKENEERFYEFSVMALLRAFFKWLSVSAYSAMNPRSANCIEAIALLQAYSTANSAVAAAVKAKNSQYNRPPIVATLAPNKLEQFCDLGEFHKNLVVEDAAAGDSAFYSLVLRHESRVMEAMGESLRPAVLQASSVNGQLQGAGKNTSRARRLARSRYAAHSTPCLTPLLSLVRSLTHPKVDVPEHKERLYTYFPLLADSLQHLADPKYFGDTLLAFTAEVTRNLAHEEARALSSDYGLTGGKQMALDLDRAMFQSKLGKNPMPRFDAASEVPVSNVTSADNFGHKVQHRELRPEQQRADERPVVHH